MDECQSYAVRGVALAHLGTVFVALLFHFPLLSLLDTGLELASLEGTAVFAFNFLVIAGHYRNFQIFKGALRQY